MVLSKTNKKQKTLVTYENLDGALQKAREIFRRLLEENRADFEGLECGYIMVSLNSEPYPVRGTQLGIEKETGDVLNMIERATAKLCLVRKDEVGSISFGAQPWSYSSDRMDAGGAISTTTNTVTVDGFTPEMNHRIAFDVIKEMGWAGTIKKEAIEKQFEGYKRFATT